MALYGRPGPKTIGKHVRGHTIDFFLNVKCYLGGAAEPISP